LVKMEDNRVTFRWRDSADNNKIKLLTLEAFEFIRRFLLHVLPEQFVKIRYYGILSHRSRKGKLLRCKKLLGVSTSEEPKEGPKESWQDLLTRITGIDLRVCPYCGKGKMIQRETLPPCSIGLADNLLPHPGCPPWKSIFEKEIRWIQTVQWVVQPDVEFCPFLWNQCLFA